MLLQVHQLDDIPHYCGPYYLESELILGVLAPKQDALQDALQMLLQYLCGQFDDTYLQNCDFLETQYLNC